MLNYRHYFEPQLMNIHTGSVAPLSEWKMDFYDYMSMGEEGEKLWGGKFFEDAELVPVIEDEEGTWIQIKTIYETYINGDKNQFSTLEEAISYMERNGMETIHEFVTCNHPWEEREYYLPKSVIEKILNNEITQEEAFNAYGDGYEPCITPIAKKA